MMSEQELADHLWLSDQRHMLRQFRYVIKKICRIEMYQSVEGAHLYCKKYNVVYAEEVKSIRAEEKQKHDEV